MGLISLVPFEIGWGQGGSSALLEGWVNSVALVIKDTTIKYTGTASALCDSGAGNSAAWIDEDPPGSFDANLGLTPAAGVFLYIKRMMSFRDLPASAVQIVNVSDSGALLASIRLTTAGKLQLWNEVGTPAQIGSDSTTVISNDSVTFYRIEIAIQLGSAGTAVLTARIDDEQFASSTTETIETSWVSGARIKSGWNQAPGANKRCWVDQGQINDSTGAFFNSWCGDLDIGYCLPISDASRTGWTDQGGGTTNLFSNLDNFPPTGGSAGADIKDLANNTTDSITLNMQSYTAAGLPTGATIQAIQPLIDVTNDGASGNMKYGLTIASNPVGTETVVNDFNAPGSLHSWDTLWAGMRGAPIYNPAISAGSSPTLTIRKATASATITQFVDLALITFAYLSSSGTVYNIPPMGRGASW